MIIIDVRTKGEIGSGMIDGAIHHDIMDMMRGIFPDVQKDSKIILYCESGNRAMMAKNFMESVGFSDVQNGGGMDECMLILQGIKK